MDEDVDDDAPRLSLKEHTVTDIVTRSGISVQQHHDERNLSPSFCPMFGIRARQLLVQTRCDGGFGDCMDLPVEPVLPDPRQAVRTS